MEDCAHMRGQGLQGKYLCILVVRSHARAHQPKGSGQPVYDVNMRLIPESLQQLHMCIDREILAEPPEDFQIA